MKKNLMIVSFAFIFLLSLSIVSAGITGYLVTRGGGIADAGTTATLQGVRDGVATIAVTTQTGDTQVVRVREGETAQVGAATISASSLTRGTLFRRAGANIALNISNISAAPVPIKVPGASGGTGAVTGHTHLSDYARRSAGINAISNTIYENAYNLGQTGKVNIPLHGLSSGNGIPGDGFSDITISNATNQPPTKHLTIGAFCEQDEVALGGGYDLSGNGLDNSGIPTYTIKLATPFYSFGASNLDGYVVKITEPYEKASTNFLDESGIQAGIVYVNCARIEPTLHQFGQDY